LYLRADDVACVHVADRGSHPLNGRSLQQMHGRPVEVIGEQWSEILTAILALLLAVRSGPPD
jgi:hypothetical protein